MSSQPFLTVRSGHPTATDLAALIAVLRARRMAALRVGLDTIVTCAPWTRRNPNPRGWRS